MGGVMEVFIMIFGVFLFPYSHHAFITAITKEFFKAKTKDGYLFNQDIQKFRLRKKSQKRRGSNEVIVKKKTVTEKEFKETLKNMYQISEDKVEQSKLNWHAKLTLRKYFELFFIN